MGSVKHTAICRAAAKSTGATNFSANSIGGIPREVASTGTDTDTDTEIVDHADYIWVAGLDFPAMRNGSSAR